VAELADLLFEQQVGALERDTLAHLLAALEGS